MSEEESRSWEEEVGLVAVGGDLDAESVVEMYRRGVFPWPLLGEKGPVFWCSPDPRTVLYPEELHVPRSLAKTLRRGDFEVRVNTAFEEVIGQCARAARPEGDGTWITSEMQLVYAQLHREGIANSFETFSEGRLVGGLYGLSIGSVFFGESMFALEDDASKVALVEMVRSLGKAGYRLIDCQQRTDHLVRFGAREIPRSRFLSELALAVRQPALESPFTST